MNSFPYRLFYKFTQICDLQIFYLKSISLFTEPVSNKARSCRTNSKPKSKPKPKRRPVSKKSSKYPSSTSSIKAISVQASIKSDYKLNTNKPSKNNLYIYKSYVYYI